MEASCNGKVLESYHKVVAQLDTGMDIIGHAYKEQLYGKMLHSKRHSIMKILRFSQVPPINIDKQSIELVKTKKSL